MARRRVSGLDLNFDSMTDLITNLAGGLILIVLLLLGLGRGMASRAADEQAQAPAAAGSEAAGPHPSASIRQRVELLRAQVAEVEQAIQRIDAQLDESRRQVDELLERLDSIQPTTPDQPRDEDEPQPVTYVPPLLRTRSDLGTDLIFVCENGRISICDPEACQEALRAVLGGATDQDLAEFREGKEASVAAGDFDIKIFLRFIGDEVVSVGYDLVRKQGHPGETLAEALRPGSRYRDRLHQFGPAESSVQYCVYPDSFGDLAQFRQVAYDGGYGCNWVPFEPGALPSVTLSVGGGTRIQGGQP